MLKHRVIFGSIMVAALMLLIFADDRLGRIDVPGSFAESVLMGQPYLPAGGLVFAIFCIISVLAASELADMFIAKKVLADRRVMMACGVMGLSVMYLTPREVEGFNALPWAMTGLVLAFIIAMVRHVARRQTEGALAAGGAAVFAFVYLGVFPGFFMLIRGGHSAWVLAAIIMLTKACDIGAYTAGRAFGKHKLIAWLSPGKTWEGLAGGICFSVGAAMILAALNNHFEWEAIWQPATQAFGHRFYSLPFAAVLGFVLAVVGHAGDLLESLFKRDAGIKDSGHTIPGFGGVLDVIDSLLFVAPFAYWMLYAAA